MELTLATLFVGWALVLILSQGDGQPQMTTRAVCCWVIPPLRVLTDCPQQGAHFYQASKFLFCLSFCNFVFFHVAMCLKECFAR